MGIKTQVRIISQTVLDDSSKLPGLKPRFKVYMDTNITLPEPLGLRDYHVRCTAWMQTYSRILQQDPSAIIKFVPFIQEQPLPF